MSKEKIAGNWVLIRESNISESDRQIERDDPLFESLLPIFQGLQTHLDLESIAKTKNLNPEDVFIDLHENYGYICIGTGENPALNEKLSDAEKIQRQQAIKDALENEKLPHILIKGKYMGVEEYTYFIPFNDKTISLSKVLQGEAVKKVERIAQVHNQDSLLICQRGNACYLYTTGSQKGNVITGKTAVVYPSLSQLPDDCYSLFLDQNNNGKIGFTCGLNFNRIYSCVDEYADEENAALQQQYKDFITQIDGLKAENTERKKIVIILRGTDGYNKYAIDLKNALLASGVNVAIFGSDANIAKINEEVKKDNETNGSKAGWTWPQIRGEFIRRNKEIYEFLLKNTDVDVIVYSDMNKLVEFTEPYINMAISNGHQVISEVVNSFIFEPDRSDYVEKLCQQYGNFMGRHVTDFKSEASQINGKNIKVGKSEIEQFHSVSVNELVRVLSTKLGTNKLSSDVKSNVIQFPHKPEPDGLLLQKFSLLLKRGVVTQDEIDAFLQQYAREGFRARADYRQSAYVGDEVIDLQAAENAGFDYFIAVNPEKSLNRQLINDYIAKSNPHIKIIFAENLENAYELLFKPRAGARLIADKQQSIGNTIFGAFGQDKQIPVELLASEIKCSGLSR